MNLELDFGDIKLRGKLFNNAIANQLKAELPLNIDLQQWGNEFYGSIDKDLGVENPQAEVSNNALAYTNHGNYFCIFFGQQPAWPVEVVGEVQDSHRLKDTKSKVVEIKEA